MNLMKFIIKISQLMLTLEIEDEIVEFQLEKKDYLLQNED
jgi:hypothetical protein